MDTWYALLDSTLDQELDQDAYDPWTADGYETNSVAEGSL